VEELEPPAVGPVQGLAGKAPVEPASPPENVAVVVNPVAGAGAAQRIWPRIARLLREAGLSFTAAFTDRPGAGIDLARRALDRGCDCVVAAGGDGTVHEVVNGLLQEGAPPQARLGIIPLGTGRDTVRTLGIPRHPAGAVARLAAGRTRWVDAGRISFDAPLNGVTERYFLNIADAGLGGETAARVNRSGKRLGGFLSFLQGALVSVATYRSRRAAISVDGAPPEPVELTTVAVANGRYFAGGMFIAPHAEMDDALFDLVIVRGMSRLALVTNLPKVYHGGHLRHPKVAVQRARQVTIDAQEQVLIQADGEVIGFLPAAFTILPRALAVIC